MFKVSIDVEAKPRAIVLQLDPETGAIMEAAIVADIVGPTGVHQAHLGISDAAVIEALTTGVEAAVKSLERFGT